jgi:hypothetical protein
MQPLDTRELGGADALDAPRPPRTYGRFYVRAALGLRPTIAPSLLFIPLGALLGPSGAGLIPRVVVTYLAPVVSASVVVLGIFIGLAVGRRGAARRVVLAAGLEAALTMSVVSASVAFLLLTWGLVLDLSTAVVALALGIVASVSSAPAAPADDTTRLAASIADFDDVLPVFAGALLLVFVHPLGIGTALTLGAWSVIFAAIIAFSADLLFRSATPGERGAFLAGAIALIAGGAAYVGGSLLLAGFVAGLVWSRLHRNITQIGQTFARLQHPMMVAMLLIAGAAIEPSQLVLWLTVPIVLFRLTGKLLGASAANRVVPSGATVNLSAALVAPGVIGVAFALQLAQVTGSAGAAIASAAAIATVVNELIGAFVAPGPRAA